MISFAWNPTGTTLAAVACNDLYFVDVGQGKVERKIKLGSPNWEPDWGGRPWREPIFTVTWSASGKKLAAATGMNIVYIIDAASGVVECQLNGDICAWSPSATKLLVRHPCGTPDRDAVYVADIAKGTVEFRCESRYVYALEWNPSGTKFAIGCDGPRVAGSGHGDPWVSNHEPGKLLIVDIASGAAEHELSHRTLSVAWHPSGTKFATGSPDGVVRIVDAKSGAVEHCSRVAHHRAKCQRVFQLAWNP